jgi:hypothetical protein
MKSAIRAFIVRVAKIISGVILQSSEFRKLGDGISENIKEIRKIECSYNRKIHIQELQLHIALSIKKLIHVNSQNFPQQFSEIQDLIHYYSKIADLGTHKYAFSRSPMALNFISDDGSIDYLKLTNIYIPGNEATIHSSRLAVPWVPMINDENTGVFLTCGQSNAGNHGQGLYVPKHDIFALDFMTSKSYRAEDPLPGASGNGGSIWSRLGDLLIQRGLFKKVLFISVAYGGTFITDWSRNTAVQQRLTLALTRLQRQLGRSCLPITATLWQQGEAEANHTTMPADTYTSHLWTIIDVIRSHGAYCPMFVAQATHCDGAEHPVQNHAAIRQAQQEIINIRRGVLRGPDIDTIVGDGRYDGCHLSAIGLQRAAELWADAITEHAHLLGRAAGPTTTSKL